MSSKRSKMSAEELETELVKESHRYELFMFNTSKKLVWIIVISGIVWISLSYVLAFQDKIQIAESLSSNVCNVVIGTVIAYFLSKTAENISKYGFVGKIRPNAHEKTATSRDTFSSVSVEQTHDDTIPGFTEYDAGMNMIDPQLEHFKKFNQDFFTDPPASYRTESNNSNNDYRGDTP